MTRGGAERTDVGALTSCTVKEAVIINALAVKNNITTIYIEK